MRHVLLHVSTSWAKVIHVPSSSGVNIVGEVREPGFLEGGDFCPASSDLALVGVGLRSNFEAVQQLMDEDLFGSRRVAVVRDDFEQNQVHTAMPMLSIALLQLFPLLEYTTASCSVLVGAVDAVATVQKLTQTSIFFPVLACQCLPHQALVMLSAGPHAFGLRVQHHRRRRVHHDGRDDGGGLAHTAAR